MLFIEIMISDDEEVECPPESLISRSVLSELTSETAKLKSMGVLNQIPANTLVKLLTILQWNIRDGTKLLPSLNQVKKSLRNYKRTCTLSVQFEL